MRLLDTTLKSHGTAIGKANAGTSKKFTLRYLILGDHANHNEDELCACPGVPALYTSIRGAIAKARNAEEIEPLAHLYAVDVEFDSKISDDDESGQPPESRTPEWGWTGEKIDEVQEFDAIEKNEEGEFIRIETKAREQIVVTRPRTIPVLQITKVLPTFSPDLFATHVDHVNKFTFWGAPPRCALLDTITDTGVTVQNQDGNPVKMRQVTFTFKFNNQRDVKGQLIGWAAYVLHQGTYYLVSASGTKREKFKDLDRRPRIGNLAENGTQLSETREAAGNYAWLKFNRFPEVDFNSMAGGNMGPYG